MDKKLTLPRVRSRTLPPVLLVFAGYLIATLLLLLPVLPAFATALPGGPVADVDGWQNVWNLWWMHFALASGQNPFFSSYLYFPTGVNLAVQTFNPSNGLLMLPITALFGPIAAYNGATLLACLLAALGAYALARRVGGDRPAAFIAGLFFAFSPFHLTKIWDGQLELIALQWLPFYALFLLRALEDGRRRDALLAGLFLAITGYTSWYYFLFLAVYSVLFVLIWLLPAARSLRLPMLGQAALVAGSGLLLVAPLLAVALPEVAGLRKDVDPENPFDSILLRSADLLDFWLPSYLHPLWGEAVQELGRNWHPFIAGWNVSLGYLPLVLSLLAARLAWRQSWRWLLLAGLALLLALGPLLQIAGWRSGLPLPYALLMNLPGVGQAHRPSHFVVLALLVMVPLLAIGLRALRERLSARGAGLVFGLSLVLLSFEFAPPAWQLWRLEAHPYYAELRGEAGAILALPPYDLSNESSAPLKAQLLHQRPLMGGFVSRPPRYTLPLETPYLQQLWTGRREPPHPLANPDDPLIVFNWLNLGDIVIHQQRLTLAERRVLEEATAAMLGGTEPVYRDEQITAYRVPPAELRPFVDFGVGWYNTERQGERSWRWMQSAGTLRLFNPTGQPQPAELTLVAGSYAEQLSASLSIAGAPLTEWQLQQQPAARSFRLLLPPGESRLELRAPTSDEVGGPRDLSIVITGGSLRTAP